MCFCLFQINSMLLTHQSNPLPLMPHRLTALSFSDSHIRCSQPRNSPVLHQNCIIPPFDELEKELDISSDIQLSEFCSKMINDDNYLKRLKIFKKDRTEWGYFRYKILIQNKKGEMFYAFDLNQYTNRM